VVVREGFGEFVRYCEAEGIKLVIVSSGLDLYIRPTLEEAGLAHLEFHSGNAEVTPKGVVVRYTDPAGGPLSKGFKDSYFRLYKRAGHTIFYLGDGHSDYGPAAEADFVMARSTLRKWMESQGLPHTPFEEFHEALRSLKAIRKRLGG
jgi:2-hydroxy-3-keto-5-methylthiopentenyl-1-phosphate phosphatase